MPSVPQIVRWREQRRNSRRSSPAGHAALGCSTLFALGAALAALGLMAAYVLLTRDLPSLDSLPLLLEPPNGLLLQPTRLYDRTGEHVILTLENPAAAGQQYLPLEAKAAEHLSPELITATLATADPTFWVNPGFSLAGLLQDRDGKEPRQPTLAQRLVADVLLWNEPPSLRRNLRERWLAAQLTVRFGRRKILEWYLNSAQYGPLVYGADGAARVYFGKTASQLSLAEAALLAAAAEAPTNSAFVVLNPASPPAAAIERQQQVLQAMLNSGMITTAQFSQALAEPLKLQAAVEDQDPAPAFTNLVMEQLTQHYPLTRLERGGLRVITSLDADLQAQATCAAAVHIARLQGTSETGGAAPTTCEAARLLPTLLAEEGGASPNLAASVVGLDPHTGQVLALVGDLAPGLDPAHSPGHPTGTLLTPFVYLTAFTRGLSPATLIWDIPDSAAADVQGPFYGPLRLRTAFTNDYLGPAAQVLAQVGPENVWQTIGNFGLGLPTGGAADLTLLQDSEFTLLQLTQAFGIFANQGLLIGRAADQATLSDQSTNGGQALPGQGVQGTGLNPVAVQRLEDLEGEVWGRWDLPQARPVVSPQLAYLINHILSDETARWPSLGHPNSLEVGRPAAAKLGQARLEQDAWTVGYTPEMVVGVWMGNADGSGGTVKPELPAALWHAILQYASRNLPALGWDMPPGVSTIAVCDPSGLLPTSNCPSVVSEVFLNGNEPVQADSLYRSYQINRETGRLATVFTLPELVEERVFLVVPPQAAAWALQAGLPTPPDSYDVLTAPPPTSPEVNIISPELFAHVGSQVTFRGSAGGAGFNFYRLQAGQGLNPQVWIQIGQDTTSPVKDGVLGVWDTTGLSGLFAVQLLVVHQDQRVETVVAQVTVDNQPPEVSIQSPADGQRIHYRRDGVVVIQVAASDDMGLAKIEITMDDQPVATLFKEPFTLAWAARQGEHILRVRAVDLAGNTREATVSFTVE